jgi:hypothetical protein
VNVFLILCIRNFNSSEIPRSILNAHFKRRYSFGLFERGRPGVNDWEVKYRYGAEEWKNGAYDYIYMLTANGKDTTDNSEGDDLMFE